MASSFIKDSEWYKDRMETQRRFEAGEISDTRRGLLNVAGSVEALYTPVELAMQGMFGALPQGLQDVLSDAATEAGEYIASTSLFQSAAELAAEYPDAAEVVGDIATIGGVLPIGRITETAANATAARIPTMLEGFYSGGLEKKIPAAAKGGLKALPVSVADAVNPKAIAYERVTGVPFSKGKATGEIGSGETEGNVSVGSAFTTDSIRRQRGLGPAPFIAEGPLGAMDEIVSLPAENTARVKDQLFKKGVNITVNVPDVVQNRALNHLYKRHKITPNKTEIKIKSPRGVQNVGQEAILDGAQQSSVILKMLSSQKKVKVGTKPMPTLTRQERLKRQVRGAIPESLERSPRLKELADTKLSRRGLPTETDVTVDSFQSFMEKKKRAVSGATEKDLVEYFNKNGIKVNKGGKGDPHLYLEGSHASTAKELGGVNDFIAVNPKTGETYAMISDGHDLFSVNPIGGERPALVAAVPMQKSNFKKPEGQKHTQTRNVDRGMSDPKTKARLEEGVKRLEKLSGIPREKGETPINYNFRVLREFNPKVTASDAATAARRSAMLGAVGTTAAVGGEEEL